MKQDRRRLRNAEELDRRYNVGGIEARTKKKQQQLESAMQDNNLSYDEKLKTLGSTVDAQSKRLDEQAKTLTGYNDRLTQAESKLDGVYEQEFTMVTTGITNTANDVVFSVPVALPQSATGVEVKDTSFKLVHNGLYTHGSSEELAVPPTNIVATMTGGVTITATFESIENAVANSPIGIVFTGKIVFTR